MLHYGGEESASLNGEGSVHGEDSDWDSIHSNYSNIGSGEFSAMKTSISHRVPAAHHNEIDTEARDAWRHRENREPITRSWHQDIPISLPPPHNSPEFLAPLVSVIQCTMSETHQYGKEGVFHEILPIFVRCMHDMSLLHPRAGTPREYLNIFDERAAVYRRYIEEDYRNRAMVS